MAKIRKSGAGRAGPGPGAGLGPVRLQVRAPGAAPGPAHPPGRGPGPGRIPLWRSKDTLPIWPDFWKYFPALGLGTRGSPLICCWRGQGLAGAPRPAPSPPTKAWPRPSPAPAKTLKWPKVRGNKINK